MTWFDVALGVAAGQWIFGISARILTSLFDRVVDSLKSKGGKR